MYYTLKCIVYKTLRSIDIHIIYVKPIRCSVLYIEYYFISYK